MPVKSNVQTENNDERKGSQRLHVLRRITRMALRYRLRIIVAIAATFVAVTFQLFIPRLLGQSVDQAYTAFQEGGGATDARQTLLLYAALLLGANVLRGLFTMLHNYQGEAVGQKIGYELRLAIYEKVQRLSFSYHDRVQSGDLITRGMLDVEGVQLFVNTGIIRLFVFTVLIGMGAYLMMSANFILALVALSFVPFVGWRAIVTRLRLRESWHRLQERLSDLTRVMEENLSGIRVVRAFSAEDYELDKFDSTSQNALQLALHRIGLQVRNGTTMNFAYFLSMGLVLLVGGRMVLGGQITVGRLTEFLAYMQILQMPVRRLGLLVNAFARATTSGERLFGVLDLEPEIQDRPDAKDLEISEGRLRFENVYFAYEGEKSDEHALNDINFEVGPGETIGLVGPPGAGKSTIAHLIPRFYDITSGRITIDGQDIRDVTLKSLRQAVGLIQQDSFIFTSRIDNNLAYGDPWTGSHNLKWAAEVSQLHDYIRQLPQGYRTLVGERGLSLSGGQRQRLAIARMLVQQSPIMIFDDSTAAIDAGTEQRIRQGLSQVSHRHATIIIAHRLSSLMHADEILFVDNGRIIERGTHEQLLELNGRYRALYDLQMNADDSETSGKIGENNSNPTNNSE